MTFAAALEGSRRAESQWTPEEKEQVSNAIDLCAQAFFTFTADEVWETLGPGFRVTKGLTARLNMAKRRGLIAPTNTTRISRRGGDHDHAQRLVVWRSLI